jgi:hypothetical protein
MYHDFTYEGTLASSLRAQWQLDDVLRADQELDFSRNFLPESLARSAAAPGLDPDEQRTLNHISAHHYLCLFGTVEEFILPFVLDHARPMLRDDDFRVRALLNFASEEAKHIHLFKRFHQAFVRGFPVECRILGPAERLCAKVLSHHPLAVGLIILMIEWMTHGHYVGSVRDEGEIDPLFQSLLKHHWMEEAQHAKLDTLMVDALADGRSAEEIDRVMVEWLQIVGFLDACLKAQIRMNIEALESAIGRQLGNRQELIVQQHRAAQWTYLGSGMSHERFKKTLKAVSPKAARQVAQLVAGSSALPIAPGATAGTAKLGAG